MLLNQVVSDPPENILVSPQVKHSPDVSRDRSVQMKGDCPHWPQTNEKTSNKALFPFMLQLLVLQMEQCITVLGKASMVEYYSVSKEKWFYLYFKLLCLAYLQTKFGLLLIILNKI